MRCRGRAERGLRSALPALFCVALLAAAAPAASADSPASTEDQGRRAQRAAPQGDGDAAATTSAAAAAAARQAYATLLYGDDFLLGVRVLGQSLRETDTDRNLVVLVTEDVSDSSVMTLMLDGWKKFPKRFAGVYTKLLIFNLTQYERVVYLDADTIAVRNMDELFLCDGLCGVLRHSERINTGVMALTPSTELFNAMLDSIATTPSYTGGDQGFLNALFADWAAAPLFDPRQGRALSQSSEWRTSAPVAKGLPLGRLPTVYNADLGLYVMNSFRWTLPPAEIRVLHFTLATFKPWDWWSGWIMGDTAAQWQALRARLPPSSEGVAGGQTSHQRLAAVLLLAAPLLLAALLVQRFLWHQGLGLFLRCCRCRVQQALAPAQSRHARSGSSGGGGGSSPQGSCGSAELQQLLEPVAAVAGIVSVPAWLTAAAACAGVTAVVASLGTATLLLIPRQMVPTVGWVLAYECTAVGLVALYSAFLSACHWHGREGTAAAPSAHGLRRPWGASILLFATILFSLGLVPWWPAILGVKTFVGRVLLTVFLGVLSAIVCTQAFISLAARWYSCGASEAAISRASCKDGEFRSGFQCQPVASAGPLQATIAVDTDSEFCAKFGSVQDAANYVALLVAYLDVVYSREIGVGSRLGQLELRPSKAAPGYPESYNDLPTVEDGLAAVTSWWNTYRQDVPRALVIYLSGQPEVDDVAMAGDEVLCDWYKAKQSNKPSSNEAYGFVSWIQGDFRWNGINNPAGVTWDVFNFAHEVGHIFGAPHTHEFCNILGNPSTVDDCARSEGYPYLGQWKLRCPQPNGAYILPSCTAQPTAFGGGSGTIMSYCDMVRERIEDVAMTLGLGHPCGNGPDRVVRVMKAHVALCSAAYPACLASGPVPSPSPSPSPSPAPEPAGSWTDPLVISSLPYISATITKWVASSQVPMFCNDTATPLNAKGARLASRGVKVLRLRSSASATGTLTLHSCGLTTNGSPTVSVRATTNTKHPQAGPWTCEGSATGGCGSQAGFRLTLTLRPNTVYDIIIGSQGTTATKVQLSATAQAGKSAPWPAAAGTWRNPTQISTLPYGTSSFNAFFNNTVPAECNDLALRTKDSITKYTGPARVFRVWIGTGGSLTVSSCNGTRAGDKPNVSVRATTNRAAPLDGPWQCIGLPRTTSSGCGTTSGGFNLTIPVTVNTWYYLIAASSGPQQATIVVDTDFQFYNLFGNAQDAANYVALLMAYLDVVFTREIGVSVRLGQLELRPNGTAPDYPAAYKSLSTVEQGLAAVTNWWNANRQDVPRAMVMHLSGQRRVNGVGMAGDEVLCDWYKAKQSNKPSSNEAYGFLSSMEGDFSWSGVGNPDGVTWDVYNFAHEVGHVFGAPHTHEFCNILGNPNTVDDCVRSEGYPYLGQWKARCPQPNGVGILPTCTGKPTAFGGGSGTIMGYCDEIRPGYIDNVAMTFGLNHPCGNEPDRVVRVMKAHVAARYALYPQCLTPGAPIPSPSPSPKPSPSPSPAPEAAGSWTDPLIISALPYTSPTITKWVSSSQVPMFCNDTATPLNAKGARLAARGVKVLRWRSSASATGTLTLHSCGLTTKGTPAVSVRATTNTKKPLAGPWTCEGSATGGCGSQAGFRLTLTLRPNTVYDIIISSQGTTATKVQLSATAQAGKSAPWPAAAGTWRNPTQISTLPYATSSFNAFFNNTVPAECNDLALRTKDSITKYTGPARVFRVWIGTSGSLTVSSCHGTRAGDKPNVSVRATTNRAAPLDGPWQCIGLLRTASSGCGTTSGGFNVTIPVTKNTWYYLIQLAAEWLQQDEQTSSRQEIEQLVAAEDAAGLEERLGKRLQFGTAGLRGRMGAGYNRMNVITVQQTTQGLVRHLQQAEPERLAASGVAIGFDGRHHSREFAAIAAAVCAAAGVPVWLFSELVPTPFVPAAVQQLGCAAGIMITASHNPAPDNGYKVYASNACQIVPPADAAIAAAIEAELPLWQLPPLAEVASYRHPLVRDPLPGVADSYYSALKQHLHHRSAEANAAAPAMAYTALHGVGTPWLLRAFGEWGLPPPILTRRQCEPDPDFSTVSFPNPEEGKGAWQLAFQAAEAAGARLAIANDPDADRFAVAERDAQTGAWRTFTGNEIGAMLAVWVLRNYRARQQQQGQQQGGSSGDKLAVLSSTVSSRMLAAIAEQEGAHWVETLTGFKWLGNTAIQLEQQGYTVLFAFEEAIGFMLGQVEHDKDGIAAAAVFAELAADVYARGGTLAQHWLQLQQQYGTFEYRSGYFIAQPPSKSEAIFERLRAAPPTSIGGLAVHAVRDLGTGVDTAQPDGKAVLPWSPGDLMVTYTLEGGAWITLRASGTEPKLKWYLETRNADRVEGERQQRGGGGGGSGGGGAKHHRSTQQQQPKQPAGLRPVSAVHQQAAYAVRRLLEADASKRGGVTLKSLTLGPQVTAKKATYAVTVEALKHYAVLQPLLERTQLVEQGRGLTQPVALVLAYELLWGEGLRPVGPAERTVLQRKADLVAALQQLLSEAGVESAAELLPDPGPMAPHPRTARVNTLKMSVEQALSWLRQPPPEHRRKWEAVGQLATVDPLLPDLLAFPPGTDLHDHPLVAAGALVLQSKASCMPAHALAPQPGWAVVDACAAPGNKTTHLAALMANRGPIFAFEKDGRRVERLRGNAALTGATCIEARHADFLSTEPEAPEFAGVQAALLDPSCSGSGTAFTRMDYLLPSSADRLKGEEAIAYSDDRVEALAQFQAACIRHTLRLPALRRLVYSTCSVHARENEGVVADVLEEAAALGFRLADPFPAWHRRGVPGLVEGAEKLVRVDPDEDGTDGFFVALFVRDGEDCGGGQQQQQEQGGQEQQQEGQQQRRRKKKKKSSTS
ncbi:phosphoglucomutase PGM3 isoform B [Chlorella sorokiniana]|uniref:phosphoglucomutase (alpha-D-glucose-1,6-bisphosphate-dependent) n=1 Tax=Chlorella sorokiniana TaxID=3076 RepID=A0A2P6TS61_CHLSO|nr:phosphoglucomutase PGM3 isoform B [Chlorella sorokiniana]|eukprot:PRW56905.1 phosphoglucomutase PGM3 isoform B [Chlorella sorokiniana]